MTRATVEELLKLPPEPAEEAGFLCIPGWQREVLRKRLEDLDRNPNDEEPWEKVKAELWP